MTLKDEEILQEIVKNCVIYKEQYKKQDLKLYDTARKSKARNMFKLIIK